MTLSTRKHAGHRPRAAPTDPAAALAHPHDATTQARRIVLDGVGREIAASFPGITRLGGQIVAALYLRDGPLSMEVLSEELGRSKSNVFANLRGLEAAGIVERRRAAGSRHDAFALRGKYPDIIVGAYLSRLRRVVVDKVNLCTRALEMLGDEQGDDAEHLRGKLSSLKRKYERFEGVFALVPFGDGPIDLEQVLDAVPEEAIEAIVTIARRALGLGPRAAAGQAAVISTRKSLRPTNR